MGNCRYCGDPAGFLSTAHTECKDKFEAGKNRIMGHIMVAARDANFISTLKSSVDEIAQKHLIPASDVSSIIKDSWQEAINEAFIDNILTEKEETNLTKIQELFELNKEILSDKKIPDKKDSKSKPSLKTGKADYFKENGTDEAHLKDQERFQKKKMELSKRYGGKSSDSDVQWAVYNEELIDHAQDKNWGYYRNTRLKMAEQLKKEMKNSHALATYIEISYIDANGPRNVGGVTDPEVLKEFPPFDSKLASQAPGVVHIISKLSEALDLNEQELKTKYLEVATSVQSNLRLNVSTKKAWIDYKEALEQNRLQRKIRDEKIKKRR